MFNLVETAYATELGELLPLEIGKINSAGALFSKLVIPAFSMAALAVVIYFIWGSFKWIISQGNKEELAAARNMIIHSIIGFILLILLFFVLELVPEALKLPFKIVK